MNEPEDDRVTWLPSLNPTKYTSGGRKFGEGEPQSRASFEKNPGGTLTSSSLYG